MLPIKKLNLQLINNNGEKFLLPYIDEPLTKDVARVQYERLKNAFGSKIPKGFFIELNNILKEKNFTNRQLMDAVTKVISNKIFPSIAELVDSINKIKLFTFHEFQKEMEKYSPDYRKYYKAVNINDSLYYVHIRELENSNLELEEWVKPASPGIKNYKTNNWKSLSKEFSFINSFNTIVKQTGIGEQIRGKENENS